MQWGRDYRFASGSHPHTTCAAWTDSLHMAPSAIRCVLLNGGHGRRDARMFNGGAHSKLIEGEFMHKICFTP